MRTETFTFDGIKRAGEPQNAGNGACDDYQGLRWEYGSARAVRNFVELENSVGRHIIKAYEHNMGSVSNLIAVTQESDGTCKVWRLKLSDSGDGYYEIDSFIDGSRDSIDITSINNILIIKCDEYNSIGGGMIHSYLWNGEKYTLWYGGRMPETPDFTITKGTSSEVSTSMTLPVDDEISVKTVYEYVASMYNRLCHSDYPYKGEGYVLICVNYTLFDGSETRPSAPVMVCLGGKGGSVSGGTDSGGSSTSVDVNAVVNIHSDSVDMSIGVQELSLKFTASSFGQTFYDNYKNLIDSVNVYSTYPMSVYDLEKTILDSYSDFIQMAIDGDVYATLYSALSGASASPGPNQVTAPIDIRSMKPLGDLLFYKQATVRLKESGISNETIEFKFGESLLGNKVMPVDSSGYIQYYGEILSYNSRLHTYNISSTVNAPRIIWGDDIRVPIDPPWEVRPASAGIAEQETVNAGSSALLARDAGGDTVDREEGGGRVPQGGGSLSDYDNPGSGTATIQCLVYLKDNGQDIIMYHVFNADYDRGILLNSFLAYPDSRAYKAEMYFSISSGKKYKGILYLTPSSAYNYSYACYEGTNPRNPTSYAFSSSMTIGVYEYSGELPSSSSAKPEISNPNVMIVSARNNPAYYAPENSYSFQGAIKAVVPLTDAVSEAQFGQFPLAVFTTEGIWALEQGSGEVLYSNAVMISNLSCDSNVIQTKTGVYFTADGGVWRLSGRTTERISSLIEGRTDRFIEECDAYARCCMSDDTVNIPLKPDIAEVISSSPYLSYDSFNDELYVGYISSELEFSYVYSVKSGLWRSDERRIMHQSGDVAVLSRYGDWQNRYGDVISMKSEDRDDDSMRKVIIRTRPFTAGGVVYKTMHRMIARCLADAGKYQPSSGVNTSGMLSLYVFGSNNLTDWNLIGGDQRTGVTDRLQIMKTAGSWKYFIVTIAGYMKAGGSISSVEAMIEDKYPGKIR